jgi:hypothetical protein
MASDTSAKIRRSDEFTQCRLLQGYVYKWLGVTQSEQCCVTVLFPSLKVHPRSPNPVGICCFSGHRHSGATSGETTTMRSIYCYVVHPAGMKMLPKLGLLFLTDALGHTAIDT